MQGLAAGSAAAALHATATRPPGTRSRAYAGHAAARSRRSGCPRDNYARSACERQRAVLASRRRAPQVVDLCCAPTRSRRRRSALRQSCGTSQPHPALCRSTRVRHAEHGDRQKRRVRYPFVEHQDAREARRRRSTTCAARTRRDQGHHQREDRAMNDERMLKMRTRSSRHHRESVQAVDGARRREPWTTCCSYGNSSARRRSRRLRGRRQVPVGGAVRDHDAQGRARVREDRQSRADRPLPVGEIRARSTRSGSTRRTWSCRTEKRPSRERARAA